MRVIAQPLPQAETAEKSWVQLLVELFKARLTLLVLLTTLFGFYAGSEGALNYVLLFDTLFGTALVACGASALNQLWECRFDACMRRTQDRPLPSGRMRPEAVFRIGCSMACSGILYLFVAVNWRASLLAAASLVVYLFLYTPLKRVTWLNTAMGAVAGALPPLIGWAAAHGTLTASGWSLFGILALWQLPHFMAIAWIYREDYARAGFKMLPVLDPEGRLTGRQAIGNTALLLLVSVCPFLFKIAGPVYLATAVLLGALFLGSAIQFRRRLDLASARTLFYVSLLYLPLLLGVMALDKTR